MSFRVRMFANHNEDLVMRYFQTLADADLAVDGLVANSTFYNSMGSNLYTILIEEVGPIYITVVRIETVVADTKTEAPPSPTSPDTVPIAPQYPNWTYHPDTVYCGKGTTSLR